MSENIELGGIVSSSGAYSFRVRGDLEIIRRIKGELAKRYKANQRRGYHDE